ncbi:MAG: hypothetical protein IT555_17710 [Acetobacteraceae bacterium]|nr:hypothetical protein [Acetobacteraceae bacterium]
MRLLLLLALLAAGAWFAPQVSEGTDGPCPALDRRNLAVIDAEVARLPPAMAADPRLARARALLADVMGATRGTMAEAMVRERFPQLPPGAGCVVGWWKLKLDPDIGEVLRALLAR